MSRNRLIVLAGSLLLGCLGIGSTASADPPVGNVSARAQIAVSAGGSARVVPGSVATSVGSSDTYATVTRARTGRYTVRFVGLETEPGAVVHLVQWARENGPAPAICRPTSWSNGLGAVEVQIRCHDAASGRARDGVRFDLWFALYRHDPVFTEPVSHAVVADGSRTTPFSAVSRPWQPTAADTSVQRTGVGVYELVFAERLANATPIVTAYNARTRWCQPSGSGVASGGTTRLVVRCFRRGGLPADSEFTATLAVGDPFYGSDQGARVRIDFPGGTLGFSANSTFDGDNENVSLGAGLQQVRLDGTANDKRLVLVAQAVDRRPRRCFVVRAVRSDIGFDPTIGFVFTRCVSGRTGASIDTTQWVRRLDVSAT